MLVRGRCARRQPGDDAVTDPFPEEQGEHLEARLVSHSFTAGNSLQQDSHVTSASRQVADVAHVLETQRPVGGIHPKRTQQFLHHYGRGCIADGYHGPDGVGYADRIAHLKTQYLQSSIVMLGVTLLQGDPITKVQFACIPLPVRLQEQAHLE